MSNNADCHSFNIVIAKLDYGHYYRTNFIITNQFM